MLRLLFIFLLALLIVPSYQELQMIDLPLVCRRTQDEVNYRINYLKLLLPTFNWIFCNKVILKRAVVLASHVLHKAAIEMKVGKRNVV